MESLLSHHLDTASEHITALEKLRKQLSVSFEGGDLGLQQQYLDESSLYIKQIPRVSALYH